MLKNFMHREHIIRQYDGRCDECGTGVDKHSAVIVKDCGDDVPVCHGCKNKFKNLDN